MIQNKLTRSRRACEKYNVSNTTPQSLTPDYFLSSSRSESYYSRKYRGSTNQNNHKSQSKYSKMARVATVSLIFLSMVTGEVFAGDKLPKSKANTSRKKEVTFEAIALNNNLLDVVSQLPLPDLIPSNPPVTPPPMPDIVPPVILPDVVPIHPAPPMALSQPDLLSDAGSSKSDKKTALLQSIRDFGGKLFKLQKVKQEPKPVVVVSSNGDLMSQLPNTLEKRRKDIVGEKKNNKFKKSVKQVIVLTAEEQKARDNEISQKIAANKEKAATLRKQKEKEWALRLNR